jgi:GAF domain-containing protein
MIRREELMTATLNAIADLSEEGSPLDERLGKSLDELEKRLGFRRSALVYHARGTAPILVGHARGSSDEATFRKDMHNVQCILSSIGEKGVIRCALNQAHSIILNDVTQDSRYVAADELSFSEACLVEALSDTASLAFNVESSTPGVFSADEIDFLASVADFFAMIVSRNASRLLDLKATGRRARMALH